MRFSSNGKTPRRTYLITGGSGFLGSSLAATLKQRGYGVRIATRNSAGIGNQVQCDLSASVDSWSNAIEGCSAIFHLAWSTVPKTANENPVRDLETNLLGTVRLLEAMRRFPGVPIVFLSSGGTVYGKASVIPTPENHPLRPITAYGASKVAAEHYFLLYRNLWNIDARIVRLSNPYGPGQNVFGQVGAASIFAAHAVQEKSIKIWGDGAAIRDYIYIDDAIEALISTMEADAAIFSTADPVINIGSGRGVSLLEMVSILEVLINRKIKVDFLPSRGFDLEASVLDVGKAEGLMGWRPRVDLEEGLRRYIAFLRDAGYAPNQSEGRDSRK